MHFAAKNLLFTFNQSLDTGFVTTAVFKRYARSPETRTFKNYFRRTHSGDAFTPYLRKRANYALARYITLHRRKKNPILTDFVKQTTNIIMDKLQQLRQCIIPLKTENWGLKTLMSQNKPILKSDKDNIIPYETRTTNTKLQPGAVRNKAISNPIPKKALPLRRGSTAQRGGGLISVPEHTKPNFLFPNENCIP